MRYLGDVGEFCGCVLDDLSLEEGHGGFEGADLALALVGRQLSLVRA